LDPGRADIHFRENALNCQDAKSILGSAKSRDKRPIGIVPIPAMREDGTDTALRGSIGAARLPQGQHAVEPELIDRLATPAARPAARIALSRAHRARWKPPFRRNVRSPKRGASL
jgi:hypothetical protein